MQICNLTRKLERCLDMERNDNDYALGQLIYDYCELDALTRIRTIAALVRNLFTVR